MHNSVTWILIDSLDEKERPRKGNVKIRTLENEGCGTRKLKPALRSDTRPEPYPWRDHPEHLMHNSLTWILIDSLEEEKREGDTEKATSKSAPLKPKGAAPGHGRKRAQVNGSSGGEDLWSGRCRRCGRAM